MFNGLPEKALRWVRNRARRIRQLRKQNEAHRELNYIENIINMFLRQLKHPNTTTEEDMSSEALAGQNTPPDGNIIPSDPVTQASLEKNTGRNINTIDHQQHFNPTNSNPSMDQVHSTPTLWIPTSMKKANNKSPPAIENIIMNQSCLNHHPVTPLMKCNTCKKIRQTKLSITINRKNKKKKSGFSLTN